jgi:hypothetical protein
VTFARVKYVEAVAAHPRQHRCDRRDRFAGQRQIVPPMRST